jgi:hypothetical protein
MVEHRPDFRFVCDHGIRGGQLDRVALLPWFADRAGWWPAEGEAAIGIWPMEGAAEKPGWDPKWLRPGVDTGPDDIDRRRFNIEIRCPAPCWVGYRSPDDKLQTLLTTITTDEKFRTAFVIRADESLIEMTLHALHKAHDMAKKYGLRV